MPASTAARYGRAMIRATRTLAVTVGAAAVLAAGCGGDDETPSATAWAGDVCSAVTTWKDAVTASAATLTAGGSGSASDRVDTAVSGVRDATTELADDLHGLGAPDTESGAQAKDAIDSLAGELSDDVDTVQKAVDDASGVNGALTAVSTVTATLAAMGNSVSATVDQLRTLDAKGELTQAFDDADSCAALSEQTR